MTGAAAPEVSVVVATRDRHGRLSALLDSLRAQSLGPRRFEVIAVDDRSTDSTPAVLAQEQEAGVLDLRVIRRPVRGGPAAARNDGWCAARASLVAFTDDDCEATPRWLEEALAASRASPGAIVQGRTEPLPRERDRLGLLSRTLRVEAPSPLFHTCNVLYPSEVLERVGGFDERTFTAPGGEDADLAWRAMERGVPARFADRAVVHHAVHELSVGGYLRHALTRSDTAAMFRHRGLRRSMLVAGIFWQRSHLAFLVALAAVAVLRRFPLVVAVLSTPYGREVGARLKRARCWNPALVPLIVVCDALEVFAAARGAIRHRVPVL